MNTVTEVLHDFINTAERNRKYPRGTAGGRRAALKLFESELNDEERESLDTFKAHLEQIYQNVFNKNKSKMDLKSLETYRNRLNALISDYEKYGADPVKMANWNRSVRRVSKKGEKKNDKEQFQLTKDVEKYKEVNMSRFELPLRSGVRAIILVPSDITKDEVNKIRKYIDFLESISNVEK